MEIRNNHIADWFTGMVNAGWVFCPWLYNDGTVFINADHYEAKISGKDCGGWVVFFQEVGRLPDPYHLNPNDPFYYK